MITIKNPTELKAMLKAGELAESAATLPEDDFFALLGEASALASDMACGILRGDKRALPEGAKAQNPCDYCDYKEICPKAVERVGRAARSGIQSVQKGGCE